MLSFRRQCVCICVDISDMCFAASELQLASFCRLLVLAAHSDVITTTPRTNSAGDSMVTVTSLLTPAVGVLQTVGRQVYASHEKTLRALKLLNVVASSAVGAGLLCDVMYMYSHESASVLFIAVEDDDFRCAMRQLLTDDVIVSVLQHSTRLALEASFSFARTDIGTHLDFFRAALRLRTTVLKIDDVIASLRTMLECLHSESVGIRIPSKMFLL